MCLNSLVSEILDAQTRERLARIPVHYQAEIRFCIQRSHQPNLCRNHWLVSVSFPPHCKFYLGPERNSPENLFISMKNSVLIINIFLGGKSTKQNKTNKQTKKHHDQFCSVTFRDMYSNSQREGLCTHSFERNSEVLHEDIYACCLAAESVLDLRSSQS